MIKHIVLIKMKGKFVDAEKDEICAELKKKLDALPALIKEIKAFETGINRSNSKNAFDLALLSDFESFETLNIYRGHPEHIKVLEYIKKNAEDVKVVDYEY